MVRIKKVMNEQKQLREIENETLFASIKNANVFSIFYCNVKVLEAIKKWINAQDCQYEYDSTYS